MTMGTEQSAPHGAQGGEELPISEIWVNTQTPTTPAALSRQGPTLPPVMSKLPRSASDDHGHPVERIARRAQGGEELAISGIRVQNKIKSKLPHRAGG